MSADRAVRGPEPAIAEDVTGKELGKELFTQLRTLSKENAEGVAQHIVMASRFLDSDIEAARAHAETAVRRAGRVAAAREMLGLVHYRAGEWTRALAEFRTVRRLSGSEHLLPLMVDCERALGRPGRALDLATGPEAQQLTPEERVELAIVVSGIRRDLGQHAAAAAVIEQAAHRIRPSAPGAARLYYAYAEALLGLDRAGEARAFFARAVDADTDLETDAAERLDELDGIVQEDLLGDDDDSDAELSGADDTSGQRTETSGQHTDASGQRTGTHAQRAQTPPEPDRGKHRARRSPGERR